MRDNAFHKWQLVQWKKMRYIWERGPQTHVLTILIIPYLAGQSCTDMELTIELIRAHVLCGVQETLNVVCEQLDFLF